jgi:hypothetical protein
MVPNIDIFSPVVLWGLLLIVISGGFWILHSKFLEWFGNRVTPKPAAPQYTTNNTAYNIDKAVFITPTRPPASSIRKTVKVKLPTERASLPLPQRQLLPRFRTRMIETKDYTVQ